MVVFHVLWDMASAHKKTANEMNKIDEVSTDSEFMDSNLFSIGFNGLHLAKAIVNSLRNHVLSNGEENFGVNILRCMKNENDEASKILHAVKNSVFVGKDRQSDFLGYMTCSVNVQKALEVKKKYNLIRIPEKILYDTENVKSHKDIINPVSICSNNNEDIFILDGSASCVFIIDRSIVAKMVIIGKYNNPDERNVTDQNEKKLFAKDI